MSGFFTIADDGSVTHVNGDPDLDPATLAMLTEMMDLAVAQFSRERERPTIEPRMEQTATDTRWWLRDRTGWPAGPWDEEPDKVQWTDAATQLPCLIVRNHSGALCGYVGVAEGHPFFKVPYQCCALGLCGDELGYASYCSHSPAIRLSAHGGLTYSDLCQEDEPPFGVCHIPEPGQPDHVWWFGFDTAHSGDLAPGDSLWQRFGFRKWETYRDLAYVQRQCAALAAQLAAIPSTIKAGGH